MRDTKCLAMILAGGQGSRLGALTKNIAKPYVPFGGKYRIIDFVLSNCTHSDIRTVGVLTQYQPLDLHTYIGNGRPWELSRNCGGVYILPPYLGNGHGDWYRGTANAVYQNMGFIRRFAPQSVLVLSGDHIYKMHYGKMLALHRETGAAATIAVIRVPLCEASRFGILETDRFGRIHTFTEKPPHPKNDLASMGIYIFELSVLQKYLTRDDRDPASRNDFGQNIIPKMLAAGEKLYAYHFDGYWKDVGTIESLWQANMDLLSTPPRFDLYDPDWTVFCRPAALPPHFTDRRARISDSIVTEGCRVYGQVTQSVLSGGVTVHENARVTGSVLLPHVEIGSGAVVENAIIGSGAVIRRGARIGGHLLSETGVPRISMIGSGAIVAPFTVLPPGTAAEGYIRSIPANTYAAHPVP